MDCVVCGLKCDSNHHCPESVENAWAAKQAAAVNAELVYNEPEELPEPTRLFIGLAALEHEGVY